MRRFANLVSNMGWSTNARLRSGRSEPIAKIERVQWCAGQEAMNIWDDVDRVGVCTDLFKDATAFEDPASRINETEFLRRCATDKYLCDYKAGDIQVSSVACTHWNQALGAAEVAMARL